MKRLFHLSRGRLAWANEKSVQFLQRNDVSRGSIPLVENSVYYSPNHKSLKNVIENWLINVASYFQNWNGTDDSNEYNIPVYIHLTFAISIIGVVSNALLLLVIGLDPLTIIRKGAWITIMNLALVDFLTSMGSLFLSRLDLLESKDDSLSDFFDKLARVNFIRDSGYSASFFLLAILTVEMFVVTKYPIRCKLILSRKKIIVACICSWILAILCGSLNYIPRSVNELFVAWIGILEFSVAIFVIFKVLVIRELLKSRRRFSGSSRCTKTKRIAKTVIILDVFWLLTAFPYFVSKELEYLARLGIVRWSEMIFHFSYYYMPIVSLNFVVNPFLYAWRIPGYRRSLMAMFICGKWRRHTRNSTKIVSGKGEIVKQRSNGMWLVRPISKP